MITIKSHGFKYSRPEANVYFDVSYFVNPWRDKAIREEKDKETRKNLILKFMEEQEGVDYFATLIADQIRAYYLLFPNENIQVAICCSAGEYRSPAMVEFVARKLKNRGVEFIIKHSDNSKL